MSSPQEDPLLDDTLTAERRGGTDPEDHRLVKALVRSRLFDAELEAPKIGRYPVLGPIGEGGMGKVYAVYDETLDRRIALKLIKSRDGEDDDARARMLREAQAMARLSHPNVLPVYEVGEHDGHVFITMELVTGTTLQAWQSQPGRSWVEVLATYLQAAGGLEAAHAAGLVHRDFKPHNVLVGSDGRVRVLDFGLARRDRIDTETHAPAAPSRSTTTHLDTPLTRTGTVVGTPAYMAPEQFVPGMVDHRADQFSFCVSLWEALYGRRPFAADTVAEMLGRIREGRVDAPASSSVPEAVRAAIERGLRSAPDDRWPAMADLIARLQRFLPPPVAVQRLASGADGAWGGLAGLLTTLVAIFVIEGTATTVVGGLLVGLLVVPIAALVGLVARRRVAWAETASQRAWWRVAGLSWPWVSLVIVISALVGVVGRQASLQMLAAIPVAVAVPAALWVLEKVLPRGRSLPVTVAHATFVASVTMVPFALLLLPLDLQLRSIALLLGSAVSVATGAAVTLARSPS